MKKYISLALALVLAISLAADAAVGIFTRTDCTTISSPVAGQTYCFDATANVLKRWNGTAFELISVGGVQLPSSTLAGLPPAGTAGRLARVTDGVRGLATDLGDQWLLENAARGIPVEWFGAKGDGVTDDTEEINSAISSGRGILFRPVTYIYGASRITLNVANTALIGAGYGTRLLQSSGTPVAIYITASRTRITNMRISARDASGATGVDTVAVYADNVTEVDLSRLWIDSARRDGIILVSTSRSRVAFNDITGVNASGAEVSGTSDIGIRADAGAVASENLIIGNRARSANKHTGINITNNGAEANRNIVVHNYVEGGATTGTPNVTGHGIIVYSGTIGVKMRNNLITNNVIRAVPDIGIYLQGNTTNQDVLDTIVEGNQIIDSVQVGTGGTLLDAAIGLDGAPRSVIKGNRILGGGVAAGAAIRVHTGSQDSLIEGNVASGLASFGQGGVYVSGGASTDRIRIVNNHMEGTDGVNYRLANGTFHQIIGNTSRSGLAGAISIGSGVNDVLVTKNFSSGDAGTIFGDSGSRTRVYDNSFAEASLASPAQITANQDDYDPSRYRIWRLDTNASRTINSIAGGTAGRPLTIVNIGSFDIVIANEGTGVAANRINTGTGANITLAANDTATLFYDETQTRWRVTNTH